MKQKLCILMVVWLEFSAARMMSAKVFRHSPKFFSLSEQLLNIIGCKERTRQERPSQDLGPSHLDIYGIGFKSHLITLVLSDTSLLASSILSVKQSFSLLLAHHW
jgi:hypothetical protein